MKEDALRRSRFCPGLAIRLADDQSWNLPDSDCPGISGPEYDSLVGALQEAGDDDDRLLAELALAIYLLDYNYRFSPDDYAAVLDERSGEGPSSVLRESLRAVATAHVRPGRSANLSPRPGVVARPGPYRSSLPHPAG